MEQRMTETVRKTVWQWEQPVAGAPARSLLRVVTTQMVVMTIIGGLLWWLGHRVMSGVVAGLAGFFLLLAWVWTTGYWALERFFQKVGVWAATALTYVLLVPFFWLCFVPARFFLKLSGKDPLGLRFPVPEATCWYVRKPHAATEPYRRQY